GVAEEPHAEAQAHGTSARPAIARPRPRDAFRGLDPRVQQREGDVLTSPLAEGAHAELTLDPDLQDYLSRMLARYDVPRGAVVALEPSTGRVLAWAEHVSETEGFGEGDVALDASPPTASVFKLVTSAALLDAGVSPDERVCYHGGGSRLALENLVDNPRRDTRCVSFSYALGHSTNAVIAKLADRHLDRASLRRYASAFAFGQGLPFELATPSSEMDVPAGRLERARTAAGFWHMHMSPLHGALLAATIANDGRMPIVDRVVAADGRVTHRYEPATYRAVIPRRTARALGRMMEVTVASGTARRSFRDSAGHEFLPGIRVAGKTGTLSSERPYRGYTWFVGFAPAEAPTIAVAALIVNTPRWRIKAAYAAREALRYYLVEEPHRRALQAAPAASGTVPSN
ncbi:MAG: penicillin-binding protein, partial [Deltaproteobacteria bacterium]|nr:penicillin-binding protein [Deltaproteobacteria bacterium]